MREYGFSKAMKELCPETWKKPLGEEWEEVFLHLVNKYSSRSYLLRGIALGDAEKLHCSMNAQYSLFTRRLFKEHGIDLKELRILEDIYIIYMDGYEIISRISDGQKELIDRLGLHLEAD